MFNLSAIRQPADVWFDSLSRSTRSSVTINVNIDRDFLRSEGPWPGESVSFLELQRVTRNFRVRSDEIWDFPSIEDDVFFYEQGAQFYALAWQRFFFAILRLTDHRPTDYILRFSNWCNAQCTSAFFFFLSENQCHGYLGTRSFFRAFRGQLKICPRLATDSLCLWHSSSKFLRLRVTFFCVPCLRSSSLLFAY